MHYTSNLGKLQSSPKAGEWHLKLGVIKSQRRAIPFYTSEDHHSGLFASGCGSVSYLVRGKVIRTDFTYHARQASFTGSLTGFAAGEDDSMIKSFERMTESNAYEYTCMCQSM